MDVTGTPTGDFHPTSVCAHVGRTQQRVGIARAVVNRPAILLADEPTGNLDPDLSREIMRLFLDFNDAGTTVLVASHDLALLETLDRSPSRLEGGRIVGVKAGRQRETRGARSSAIGLGGRLRAWRRNHHSAARASLARLLCAPFATTMIVMVIAVALSLPAGLWLLLVNLERTTGGWDGASSLTAFLQSNAIPRLDAVVDSVRRLSGVREAKTLTPEQSLEEFREMTGLGQALDILDENPLPAALIVFPTGAWPRPNGYKHSLRTSARLRADTCATSSRGNPPSTTHGALHLIRHTQNSVAYRHCLCTMHNIPSPRGVRTAGAPRILMDRKGARWAERSERGRGDGSIRQQD